jgi:RHS repeat-associated protein
MKLNDTKMYVYGPGDVPVEQINNSTGTIQYLHHDQQGSTRLLTGEKGEVTGSYTYDAYGNTTGHTGTATTPLGYDGQYTSSDTGLIYLRARAYDPATAQFLTVDPLGAISGEPYGYAGDNPLTYGDSLGLLWTPLAGGAAGADAACGATFEIPGVDLGTCGAAGIASGAAALGTAVGVVTAIAGEEGGDEGEAELKAKEAERENCGNPAIPPGSKFEWKGNGPEGSNEGAWVNPDTEETLHPDLSHPEPHTGELVRIEIPDCRRQLENLSFPPARASGGFEWSYDAERDVFSVRLGRLGGQVRKGSSGRARVDGQGSISHLQVTLGDEVAADDRDLTYLDEMGMKRPKDAPAAPPSER